MPRSSKAVERQVIDATTMLPPWFLSSSCALLNMKDSSFGEFVTSWLPSSERTYRP